MTDKNRNFRSSYYDKVGFRGVEEKKSLEILINEKPMDIEKLSKFCLRFTLPAIYREYVWKTVLGILPLNADSHRSILDQRNEHYKELEHSLRIMKLIDKDTERPIVHTLMFLLTEEGMELDIEKQLSTSKIKNLIALASLFIELSSSEVIAYWLLRNFVLYQRKLNLQYKAFENLEIILRKEDETLWEHLKHIKAFDALPLESWFEKCFSEVLHEVPLARVCDKVIGGSCKILLYVAAALLTVRRHLLLPITDSKKIIEVLEKNPEDVSKMVVNKALDLYYT